jgi:hypothetical protein
VAAAGARGHLGYRIVAALGPLQPMLGLRALGRPGRRLRSSRFRSFCLRFRSSCCGIFSFTTTALSAHQVYVFGGNEGVWQFLPLNDLWAFDVGTALCIA